MKILITGATGFIGSFIVEEALNRGFDTWAAVRGTSSKQYLQDERINFISLNFGSQEQLTEALSQHQFDYIVHAAGVTKCLNHEDFFRMNTEGTKHFVEAILATQRQLKKFVFLSSLSIYGAIREKEPHLDILLTDRPKPNTDYGRSKHEAEKYLRTVRDRLNYTILRPTGVYGPREKDYFLMAKSIVQHTDFAVGRKRQDITFVYVTDVVQAVFLALKQEKSGKAYFLTDGEVYQSATFSDYLIEELGNPWCLRIVAPVWVLKVITTLGDFWGRMTGTITALNNDKYHILKQRNWRCDVGSAMMDLGYDPKVKLREGVRLSVKWYKENGWL